MTIACALEFGAEALELSLPEGTDLLALPEDRALERPAAAIRESLTAPIGTAPLAQLVREKRALNPALTAAVVVSDNTRPVPYRGEAGILEPVLNVLRGEKVERIEVLVATGTHRPMTEAELRAMLCESAFAPDVKVVNHRCEDRESLRNLGRTDRGTEVWIDRRYVEADLKILTGFVEPHFMAGASGGGKSICPGLVGEEVMTVFHGAKMMADERCSSLVIEGNPSQEESRAVARMAGVDFILNVTLNRDKQVTGVFAGELLPAHDAAIAELTKVAAIRLDREYDLVVTHAGFVGINHYQAAKAATEAARALRAGGSIVMAANNTDVDPVGSDRYRTTLRLLRELGAKEFNARMLSPEWQFTFEQWQPQMWARALVKLGETGRLVYCAPQLANCDFETEGIPGVNGCAGVSGDSPAKVAEAGVQQAVDEFAAANPGARIAVLLDGPYGVPIVRRGQ
jgi:nickel-dependent lactate racemase